MNEPIVAVLLWLATVSPTGRVFSTTTAMPSGMSLSAEQLCEKAREEWLRQDWREKAERKPAALERRAICIRVGAAGDPL